mmetsp:Transcript_34415/g.47046  ORF Transcript_34415/g.47046 Transcript_34415/m.47046 type:complete len:150 (-) Transcript_34415:107-556(-)
MTWQIAKGILIPKKKDIKIGKDLRPIMLQPNIYKIFSGVLGSKIHDFAKDNKIWSDEQRGYTNLNGTMLNLSMIQAAKDNISRHRSSNEFLSLFVDVQNAFGAVEYKQMITILFGLGLPKKICVLIWGIMKAGVMIFSHEKTKNNVPQS